MGKSRLVDANLDSTAGGRPNFRTTQWGLVVAAAEGAEEARAALEELYRLYCYPVYAFIRRRGHGRQDAQDLTQDFFLHLLEKGTLARADSQQGRFRSIPGGITTMNAIEVVQQANKAYNAHDAGALSATYAEGATYSNPRAADGLLDRPSLSYLLFRIFQVNARQSIEVLIRENV